MQYNAMQGLQAFGAGRQMGTEMRVGNALAEGDMQGAQQAAFRGGDVGTGMQLQQARQNAAQQARAAAEQMTTEQAAASAQNARRLGALGATAIQEVAPEQIDAWVRSTAPQYGIELPDRQQPYTRADLEMFVAQAQAMDEELTAYLDRGTPQMQGQNEAMVGRRGGVDFARTNPMGERIAGEDERSNRAGEAIDRFQADTGRMSAATSRMGEVRQGEAVRREMAGEADQGRRAQAIASRMVRNNLVLEDIDRAIEGSGDFGSTGFLGQIFSNVGGTGARDLEALIDTVRANIGFDELQRMRDMSPTGGALGQVTERELAQLQAVLGNLETSQSQAQLEQNLRRLQQVYREAQSNIAEAYRQDFGEYPQGYQGGQSGSNPAQRQPSGGGQRLRYNPQTGELE